jgi:RNA:NAD 2'-phosphotransferase (TPT1/KptA family)
VKLYHATPATNVESILRDGLRLQSPTWPIHLSTERHGFESLVAFCHSCPDDQVAILAIDATDLWVSPGMDGPTSLATFHPIPASLIRPA